MGAPSCSTRGGVAHRTALRREHGCRRPGSSHSRHCRRKPCGNRYTSLAQRSTHSLGGGGFSKSSNHVSHSSRLRDRAVHAQLPQHPEHPAVPGKVRLAAQAPLHVAPHPVAGDPLDTAGCKPAAARRIDNQRNGLSRCITPHRQPRSRARCHGHPPPDWTPRMGGPTWPGIPATRP